MIKIFSKFPRITSVFFSLLVFATIFPSLSLTPIVTRGEGREGQVIQAMQRTGDVILPLRNGTSIPSKPPLFHWISFAGTYLSKGATLSNGAAAIRLPSILSAALLVGVSVYFIFLFSNAYISILSILILSTLFEFLRYSTQARVDMVFAAVFSSAMYMLYGEIRMRTAAYKFFAIVFLVLSILAKGPFGILIPGAIVFIFLLFRGRIKDFKLLFELGCVFVISGMLAGIWYYLAYDLRGSSFIETQFLKENMARVLKSESDELGHEKPFFFSLVYLLQVLLPWVVFLPRAAYGISKARIREVLSAKEFTLFNLIWAATFILAITFSVSKRSVYYLPALAPICFIFASLLELSRDQKISRFVLLFESLFLKLVVGVFSLLVLASFYFNIAAIFGVEGLAPITGKYAVIVKSVVLGLSWPFTFLALLIILITVLSAYKTYRDSRFDLFAAKFSSVIFLVFLMGQYIFAPSILGLESPIEFAVEVENAVPTSSMIYQYDNEFYAPVFYLSKSAPIITKDELKTQAVKYLLISEADTAEVKAQGFNFNVLVTSKAKLANRHDKLCLIEITY